MRASALLLALACTLTACEFMGWQDETRTFNGRLTDAVTGAPVADAASVQLFGVSPQGLLGMDRPEPVDGAGAFSIRLYDTAGGRGYRLRAASEATVTYPALAGAPAYFAALFDLQALEEAEQTTLALAPTALLYVEPSRTTPLADGDRLVLAVEDAGAALLRADTLTALGPLAVLVPAEQDVTVRWAVVRGDAAVAAGALQASAPRHGQRALPISVD